MRLHAVIAAMLTAPACAFAQVPNPIDCGQATTTVELNYCADRDYLEADRKLNEAYQALLARIKASDGPAPYSPAEWEAALRASQRAWIAFRDAECKGLVPMAWSGGSGTTLAVLGCMRELTEARTEALSAGE